MPRRAKIAVSIALLAAAGFGAWLALHDQVNWKTRAREQASRLAVACTPHCTRSPLKQTIDGRWRLRLKTASGINQCFLLQPRNVQKERPQKSGIAPCNRNDLRWWPDWKIVRAYRPTSEVASLASEAGMSDLGKELFFSSRPRVVNRQDLVRMCKARHSDYIEGCLTPSGRLYIIRVSRDDLRGVMVVAAAHEMLHAAYRRLSSRRQTALDALTDSGYSTTYRRKLHSEIETYPRRQVASEVHSRLGTEYESLSSPLEDHYRLYFTSRERVLKAYAREMAVVTRSTNAVSTTLSRLRGLKQEVQRLDSELDSLGAEMDALEAAGDVSAYNNLVPQYNALVQEHNRRVPILQAELRILQNEFRELSDIRRSLGG